VGYRVSPSFPPPPGGSSRSCSRLRAPDTLRISGPINSSAACPPLRPGAWFQPNYLEYQNDPPSLVPEYSAPRQRDPICCERAPKTPHPTLPPPARTLTNTCSACLATPQSRPLTYLSTPTRDTAATRRVIQELTIQLTANRIGQSPGGQAAGACEKTHLQATRTLGSRLRGSATSRIKTRGVASRPVRSMLFPTLRSVEWPSLSADVTPASSLRPYPRGSDRAAHPACSALLRLGFVDRRSHPLRWCALPHVSPYRLGRPEEKPRHRRSVLCGTFLRVAPDWVLPPPALWSRGVSRPGPFGPDAASLCRLATGSMLPGGTSRALTRPNAPSGRDCSPRPSARRCG